MIDPCYPDHSNFETKEYDQWREFYPDAEEEIPDSKRYANTKRPTNPASLCTRMQTMHMTCSPADLFQVSYSS